LAIDLHFERVHARWPRADIVDPKAELGSAVIAGIAAADLNEGPCAGARQALHGLIAVVGDEDGDC